VKRVGGSSSAVPCSSAQARGRMLLQGPAQIAVGDQAGQSRSPRPALEHPAGPGAIAVSRANHGLEAGRFGPRGGARFGRPPFRSPTVRVALGRAHRWVVHAKSAGESARRSIQTAPPGRSPIAMATPCWRWGQVSSGQTSRSTPHRAPLHSRGPGLKSSNPAHQGDPAKCPPAQVGQDLDQLGFSPLLESSRATSFGGDDARSPCRA